MNRRRPSLAALALLALLLLCRVHISVPAVGAVPAAVFVLCAEVAALAVIATGIARSLGWRVRAG